VPHSGTFVPGEQAVCRAAPVSQRLAWPLLLWLRKPAGRPTETRAQMDRLDQFFGLHGQALMLRSERLSLLASNIANAATPGYKARDLDFAAALAGQPAPRLNRTDARHLSPDASGPAADSRIRYRAPIQPSLDGNTVELATEQLQFAESALRYRSTLQILNGRISGLTSALKGE
jgi:flagellar basal-body rod protein FlgB